MYYNKPKGFRSSVRRGDSQNNRPYRKPFRSGSFNQVRNGGGRGLHESKLKGQIDIFIKKATQASETESISDRKSVV